jgi:3-phenylpropionate/cinnamic acid dioxygenase small subunit
MELEQLAYRYASAVDARDVEAFLDVFTADGRLATYAPGTDQPFAVQTTHPELAIIPKIMAERFTATMHMMANCQSRVDGDRATGSVYCTARHLFANPSGGMDLTVLIRYEDRYRLEDGRWRIAQRDIRFLWSETTSTLTATQSVMA